METAMTLIAGLLIFLLLIWAYFFPGWIAERRKHNNVAAIIVINLFLGWTFVGWVAALAWAMTDNTDKG